MKSKIQVPPEMYYGKYDNLDRFISYFHQIELVKPFKGGRILEVGIGNKTVANYLRHHGYDIITCDFDGVLCPDHVADIRALPFEDNSFDVILAYEILEHLPFGDVPKALSEMHRCTKQSVLVSVPYSAALIELQSNIRLPRISKKWNIALRIPYFMIKTKMNDRNVEHYWEIGRYSYSKSRIRKLLMTYYHIEKEFMAPMDSYHYYYALRKKYGSSEKSA